ncbi:MAG TPA: EAL domain-containing protein [Actinomycetota bacterium]|nr:EAL domain-containing protein [Actinomycetota bacterium]
MIEEAPDAFVAVDADGAIQLINRRAEAMFGYDRSELLSRELELLVPGDFREAHRQHRADYARHPFVRPMGGGLQLRGVRKDGSAFPVDVSLSPVGEGPARLYVAAIRDVSERKAAEAALHQAVERFRSAFEKGPVGMAVVGLDGVSFQVNEALSRLLGRAQAELTSAERPLLRSGPLAVPASVLEAVARGEIPVHREERRVLRHDGQLTWARVTLSRLTDERGGPASFLLQVEDVTAGKVAEATLLFRAAHDPLTRLPNRTLLMERLRQALARSERRGSLVAVLFIDLDEFKRVNDALGHEAGDRLLVEVADRLRGILRQADTASRFGGDEFVLVCEDLETPEEAVDIARRVIESLGEPVRVGDRELRTRASVGVAVGLGASPGPRVLIRDADAAMYQAKERGGGGFQVFNGLLRPTLPEDLEADMLRAIDRQEFYPLFQLESEVGSSRLTGFEALARWRHPNRGLLIPSDFLPYAEESGLIVRLGALILRQACAEAACWAGDGAAPGVSVNLSPRQLASPDLRATVATILDATGLDPVRLCLEITEPGLLGATAATLGALDSLRKLGVRVCLDGFGTGFASLNQVADLRPDSLKVDRALVQGLDARPENEAVVVAVVALAHSLGVLAVAEGVETPRQLELAGQYHCDRVQGYLLGPPEDADTARRHIGGPPVGGAHEE